MDFDPVAAYFKRMCSSKIDIMSPAFLAGFFGWAVEGSATGFVVTALVVYFLLWAFFVLLFAIERSAKPSERPDRGDGFAPTR